MPAQTFAGRDAVAQAALGYVFTDRLRPTRSMVANAP
jgi:hypothetical protein